MRDHYSPSPSVVVGIDGSRSALDAALWAVDEAVSRDIPLRLVYAIDPADTVGTDPQDAARDLATAEVAVRYAFTAVESTDKPVKIEVEILQDRPTRALLEASRWAAMVCVGSIGTQTQRPRADWLDRGGAGVVRPLPRGHRPRTRSASGKHNSGWSPSSTSLLPATVFYGARSRRRSCEVRRCGC